MRAFIALEISEVLKQRAEELEKEFQIEGLTLVKTEAMHITLQFLGETSVEQAEKVVGVMKKLKVKPFRLDLAGLSYFSPRLIRVIFVEISNGIEPLQDLYNKLSDGLTANGIRFEEENYTPHLTIARAKRVRYIRKLREILDKNSKVELGSFEVRSVALKESTLTPEGPVYRDLYKLNL